MRVFITGTDTDVGKTTISSWLCLHTKYAYYKPIQTGNTSDLDKEMVRQLSGVTIYEEAYSYKQPVSPHLAAKLENDYINLKRIKLPAKTNLIVEGAGGLLVPVNNEAYMIDLIKLFEISVILVARSTIGTINHTLLSLEALRRRNIKVLGVIVNGTPDENNKEAIEFYGRVKVLASFPYLPLITQENLMKIELSPELKSIFNTN